MYEDFICTPMTIAGMAWRMVVQVFSCRGVPCVCAAALLVMLSPLARTAEAQEVSGSLAELMAASKVKEGDRIDVVDSSGRTVTGSIVRLSAATLEVARRRGVLRLDEREIRTIVRRDSVENGVWLGVAAGLGAWFAFCAREDVGDCFGYMHSAGLMFTAPAALLGWAVDSSMNETVYVAQNAVRLN